MDLKFLKRRLQLYLQAEEAVLQAQSYTIGDRILTRANLKEIQSAISELTAQIEALELRAGGRKRVCFID